MARDPNTYRAARSRIAKLAVKPPASPQPPSPWVTLGIWVEAGGVALVAGLIYASFAAAGVIDMTLAYLFLAVAWIAAILTAAFSEKVRHLSLSKRITIVLLVSVVGGLLLVFVGRYEYKYKIELTKITPDNLPTPKNRCDIPDGALKVILGSNFSYANSYPHTVIAIGREKNDKPYAMLAIDKEKSSDEIIISILRIFGDDGRLITRIDDSEPFINSNFRSKKPDPHTLMVYNDRDIEVLNLHFLNKNTLKVGGIFFRPNIGLMNITDNAIEYPFKYTDGCQGGNGVDFMIDTK
jgi:hypothetical protein